MNTRVIFFVAALVVAFVVVGAVAFSVVQPTGAMPEAAVAGYAVWQANGCESCHTLYGYGGAYGPDLTGIHAQRGAAYLADFMVHPQAYHPGERIMPGFGLTVSATDDEGNIVRMGETEQVIAFLDWVGAAQAWPPRNIAISGGGTLGVMADSGTGDNGEADTAVQRGQRLFAGAPGNCASCHSLERDVVIVGPSLWDIADRAAQRVADQTADEYLRNSITNPGDYVVEGYGDVMAKNLAEQLSSEQLRDIVAYLMTLEGDA